MRWRPSQRNLDAWFPTVVRYAGITLLVYAIVFRADLTANPAFWPAIGGAILFKSVIGDGKRD